MIQKKHIPLLVALVIPLGMIVLVAATVYIPKLGNKPQYDFVHVSTSEYPRHQYLVTNGKLERREITYPEKVEGDIYPTPPYTITEPTLYLHDIERNESTTLSFEEAAKLNLDSAEQSPDGYTVGYNRNDEGLFGIFFGGSYDYDAQYVTGHNQSIKLNLPTSGSRYGYRSFQFLGWVK